MTTRPLFFAAALAVVGCTTRPISAPVTLSTKPLPELFGAAQKGKKVDGESCTHVVLLFIPFGVARAEEAYAEALGKAPGADALVAYETRTRQFAVIPFYHRICTEAHGYAVTVAEGGGG